MATHTDHEDLGPFRSQFSAVVTSYLDGNLPLDAAAGQLAAILRAEHERPRTEDEQKQQREDMERWGKEDPVVIAHRVFPIAQGRSSADLDKVRALLHAMIRLVQPSNGAA